ncbi:hypothetical protein ACH4ZU_25865 [Streptomyces sp. NPDC020472]|uniref:hypothetical protein n=1 Tax=Streptomyces sp. NPDC020472 TaxID=3365075 RepID=UPI0037AC081E
MSRIEETSAQLGGGRDRFEGLPILMFSSPDVDTTANRLTAAGVGHGGVNTVGRPADTPNGVRTEPVRYLEIDEAPEGRVGVVGDLDPESQHTRHLDHPNGAQELVEAVLCVPDGQLRLMSERYKRHLGRPISVAGPVTLPTEVHLPDLLPGADPPAPPALVAYTVAVPDIARVRALLAENGLPVRATIRGELFVPVEADLGAAVIFREI